MIELLVKLFVHFVNEAPYVLFLAGGLVAMATLFSGGVAVPDGSAADRCQEDADSRKIVGKRMSTVISVLYATAPFWLSAPVGYVLGSIGGQTEGWTVLALFMIPAVGSCGTFKVCGSSSASFFIAVLYYPFGWAATLAIGYLGGLAAL